jgi:iron(III) transport system permease protein
MQAWSRQFTFTNKLKQTSPSAMSAAPLSNTSVSATIRASAPSRERRSTRLWIALTLTFAAVLMVPIAFVLASVFQTDKGAWQHIAATVLPDLLQNSALLITFVGFGVIAIGTTTAWLTANYEFAGRRVFAWALILPLAMPAYVMAYVYTDVLQYAGPVQTFLRATFGWQGKADYWFFEIRSVGGAACMLMFVLYPYVYMLARVAFLEQSRTLTDAGRTFGYSASRLFFNVSLPLARPAIVAGTALALMETLADYGTVSYFGVNTFTTGIFNAWFSQDDRISAAKLAALMMTAVVLMMVAEQWARRRARYDQVTAAAHQRIPLQGVIAWLASAICAAPVAIGFVIPVLILLRLAASEGKIVINAHFFTLAFNSFTLAALTALVAVAIALWLAYAARSNINNRSGIIHRNVNRLLGLGYAVPGTIIAVGVLIPLVQLDHWLVDTFNGLFNAHLGLLLTGGIAVLVYAYLIRFLAIALHTVEAGLSKITPHMDDAAQSLGATRGEIVLRVHAPLLRVSLVTAALLVFVDVMKELPATLVMRPFNFDTLAVHTYVLAKDERLAEAALPALAIVLVGLLPVILASRRMIQDTKR